VRGEYECFTDFTHFDELAMLNASGLCKAQKWQKIAKNLFYK